MKRKFIFLGMLLGAMGAALLLGQQLPSPFAERLLAKDSALGSLGAGRFPDFIAMPGVIPRGVAVDKAGYVYVSASVGSGANERIKVWKYTPAGEEMFSVDIGQGTIGGLMVSAEGDLYIALAAGRDRGVWRMDRKGNIELLPGSNQIFFANGLAFDNWGNLYVAESVSVASPGPPPSFGPGGIWRIRRGGQVELCLRDELLRGTGALGQPVPIGANGIAYFFGNLFVTNTERGTVLRVPVCWDGRLGPPQVWKQLEDVPESPLAGAPIPVCGDGLILDVFGNIYIAVLTRSAVVRINPWHRSQTTVAAFQVSDTLPRYAPFDFPASLFFGKGKGEWMNLFVTNTGMGASLVPGLPWPGPGLVKIKAGVPGHPFH